MCSGISLAIPLLQGDDSFLSKKNSAKMADAKISVNMINSSSAYSTALKCELFKGSTEVQKRSIKIKLLHPEKDILNY
jgi:hypothetical protein